MKTKFTVEIHKSGSSNDALIRMITNHNEGKVTVDLELMRSYIFCQYAMYPTITPETKCEVQYPARKLCIEENNEPTLTITEREVYELTETEADLLTKEKLS